MVEGVIYTEKTLEKARQYAAQLAQWDNRLVEIAAIGSLVSGDSQQEGKIDLVCTFDPEPVGNNTGYVSVINLLLRDDHEKLSEHLGIEQPIDLGFRMGDEVYLANGEIHTNTSLGEQIVLWGKNEG